ncbi:pentapeptide repeat-containing protein [Brevibacillus sp. SYSU BS000544]|uniref:pentapeptide repeat-containing protein n=1 Tax=Brevibacillus sp. SYSU BS000544 TaxID=3416443 RepID=UPI003CE50DE3
MFENVTNHPDPNCNSNHNQLSADCEKCFGLCCVALPFAASADFAIDKASGIPCSNLQQDFRCKIHPTLRQKGFKGCTVFDCFGAGQKVSQDTFEGMDWRKSPEIAKKMYNVFPIMHQLHEMLWYLTEALTLDATRPIHKELTLLLNETEQLSHQSPEALLALDVSSQRAKVNVLLLQTGDLVWTKVSKEQSLKNKKRVDHRRADLMGANLRGKDLRGANFRGAFLIAADLRDANLSGADMIGADLRDANLSGADLGTSIFLTQAQINSAKGDSQTNLPHMLSRPPHWS